MFVGGTSLGSYDRVRLGVIIDLLESNGIAAVTADAPASVYTRTHRPELAELIVPSDKAAAARDIIARQLPLHVAAINARASVDPDFSDRADDEDPRDDTLTPFGWLEPDVAKVFIEVCAQNGIACEPEYPLDRPAPPYAREDGRVLMHVDQQDEAQAAELLETRVRDLLAHRWIQFTEPLRGEDLY